MPRDLMADYIPVNERLAAFYLKHPDGSIQSELVELSDTRVVMRALAYRKPDDERPGIGYSSMNIPGATSFTRGSEIENTETSAWGRAIAALGFEVKRGIASREEVQNKQGEQDGRAQTTHADGLIGKAVVQGTQDFELRESPTGWTLPFRVKDGSGSQIVIAKDAFAQMLAGKRDEILGQTVTVWGPLAPQTFTKAGKDITFQVMTLERIKGPGFDLAIPDEPDDNPFTPEEQARIDAAIASAGTAA